MKIEEGIYEGYIWMSDQQTPEVYDNEKMQARELDANENPFIIEAQLYEVDKEISYSVKYVDGAYRFQRYVLADFEGSPSRVHMYYPNRMDKLEKGTKLCFCQYWKPEKDEFCEDMEVLQPDKIVFIGFERKEESK